MELWISFTVAGAFLQNLRSVLQKHLKGRLSDLGATYVRFLYALPFALIYVWALNEFGGKPFPETNGPFLLYCALGGLSQILFTFLLIYLFGFRNFTVGTTLSKTEVVQIAILGFLILGDEITLIAALAVGLAFIGVMVLSAAQSKLTFRALIGGLGERSTVIGLVCGAFLGGSVVFYRGAALALGVDDAVMAAAFTLAAGLLMQVPAMGLYLLVKEPRTLRGVVVYWKPSLSVGVMGVAASICWFTAFTLENAAYVRALGQIELIFTFMASWLFFREKSDKAEVLGILMIAASILILVLAR